MTDENPNAVTPPPLSYKTPTNSQFADEALDLLEQKRSGEHDGNSETDEDRAQRLRNERDGLAALRIEGEQRREAAEQERENARKAEAEQADQHIREAAEWAEPDQQKLQALQQRADEFNVRAERFQRAQEWAQANRDAVTEADKRELAQEAQALQEERDALQQAAGKVQEAAQIKSAETERRRMQKDIPDLANAETRRAFIEWARGKGFPEDAILSETRRNVLGPAYEQFRKEKAEARRKRIDRPRPPVYRDNRTPEAMTVQQAKERLKSRGSVNDALNVLTIERERAREASESE